MILVVGAGYMAFEYVKVLKALDKEFVIIGNSQNSATALQEKVGEPVEIGGLDAFLERSDAVFSAAIVCTPIQTLRSNILSLAKYGVKRILTEKPGALDLKELNVLREETKKYETEVLVGYNRRFFQSTLALKKILQNENLIAVNFEITEWAHTIDLSKYDVSVLEHWMYANTSHVIDLVFHVSGMPTTLNCFTSGKLDWHPSGASFCGAGITEKDVLISYSGFWDAPGRWSVEFVTTNNRFIFRPIEKLQVQRKGSVAIEFDDSVNYELDEKYKPGLFLQTKAFLENNDEDLCDLDEQVDSFNQMSEMANYISVN